ncbi:haloacid dehalogenase [Lentzea sp. NBRC 105346]|uniref:Cof-type HAD-IIB family hydrolase n=1 Tax=Lentzea sp. NBRC 105346 TaxID=3032205 RepID=UPI0024A4C5E3|nr:Cof-type HAD-IIB family hydrolase [Lentzea sp. NBRC 105346]GLZ32542.1 haloacid dehalogenase [Lentzea sp. NBRC 105346]
MEKPALVASDVDGTLLGTDEQVSEYTARTVGRVVEDGTPFVLVSGRPPRWMSRVAQAAGTHGYAVCANGAVLYDLDEDRVLWQRGISPQRLNDLANALDTALPGCALAAERVGARALDVEPFLAEEDYKHLWADGHGVATRAEVLGHTSVKVLVRHEGMTSGEMAAAIRAVIRDEFAVTYSASGGLIEISERNVTKATGLADVAERLGVAASSVIAFGDMPNDVPMVQWAGHGVAMANAHPELLEVADEVTGTNDQDGVALVLERWF